MVLSGDGFLGVRPWRTFDAVGLANNWGLAPTEGNGIAAARKAGMVTLDKRKFSFDGGNSPRWEVIGTSLEGGIAGAPTGAGGLTAAMAGVSVADPSWITGTGSGRYVLRAVNYWRRDLISSVRVAISLFRGNVVSFTLAVISACQA